MDLPFIPVSGSPRMACVFEPNSECPSLTISLLDLRLDWSALTLMVWFSGTVKDQRQVSGDWTPSGMTRGTGVPELFSVRLNKQSAGTEIVVTKKKQILIACIHY